MTTVTDSAPSRIVHIGFGAFARGHQLLYSQLLKNQGHLASWQYTVVSLFSTGDIQKIKAQDYHYHVLQRSAEAQVLTRVDVITDAKHPKLDGTQAVIALLANANTKIISLTITEKGYCSLPGRAGLDWQCEKLQADARELSDTPAAELSLQTALGYIVAGLKERCARAESGLTLMSCDNLPNNGGVLKSAVLALCKRVDLQYLA